MPASSAVVRIFLDNLALYFRMLRQAPLFLFLLLLPCLSFTGGKEASIPVPDDEPEKLFFIHPEPYLVPEQDFDFFAATGVTRYDLKVHVNSFGISPQIALWEYQEFLDQVKKDSSEKFYRKLLPDTGMCLPEAYRLYFDSKDYELFPVVGVSWEAAMQYMRWLTMTKNKDGIYDTIYLLPSVNQWVAANRYFSSQESLKKLLDGDYADWTIAAFDESAYDFMQSKALPMDYSFDAKDSDPPVLKRKRIAGNSFHRSNSVVYNQMQRYGYQDHGYSDVGFRYVYTIEPVKTDESGKPVYKNLYLKKWGLWK